MKNRHQQQQAQLVAKRTNSFNFGTIASNDATLKEIRALDIRPEHISYLAGYIVKYIKSPDDVNVLIQDTLLAALQAYPYFNAHSSLKTWLIGIAKHQIARFYRQKNHATRYFVQCENIAVNAGNQEDEEYQAARNEELFEHFSSLPKADQQILYWHAMDGLQHAEIGQKLGISERAVNMRISRARGALRRVCEKSENMSLHWPRKCN
jgi:RNA polymerase sigma factor (sigma-70 family)